MTPITIFILLTLVAFIMDYFTNECVFSYYMIMVLFLHHIINIFVYFGWIFNDKHVLFAHVIFPLLVLLHWRTNDNKCYLTQIINKHCCYDDNYLFRDFTYMLGLKTKTWFNNCGIYFVVGASVAVSVYKIFYY